MIRRTRTPITALTLAAICGLACTTTAALAQRDNPEPLAGETLLPVQRVTLYRSGVGAFERQGLIDGSATVALRFETDQINDILKSMVLLDLDGGRVAAVGYGSQEPLDRRLASFAIDLSGNPSVVSLLRQLRGAAVDITTLDRSHSGTVLSTEQRRVKADDGKDGGTMEFVNLLDDSGSIRSIAMSEVLSFRLEDDELQRELTRALSALGESSADRTKSVELRFDGQPGRGRRVVVAYVTEMPVWKTSYRLVLDEDDDPTIHGWAIVENTTDHDWEDVTLSLAAGRPVGFTMDLYQPLFASRPNVPVPFIAGVAPRVFESQLNRVRSRDNRAGTAGGGARTHSLASQADAYESEAYYDSIQPEMLSMNESALDELGQYAPSAQASAGFAGETFMFTVDTPVTIERQRSAMLPIITAPIEGRRVSIFNPAANATNPMRGVELTNDSGMHLMPGPIAVYDAGTYAGDAQIPHTSRTQTRLLAYSVDLPVRCETEVTSDSSVRALKIDNGMLVQTNKSVRTTEYRAENNDEDRDRTLLIEHPRAGGWDLAEPKEADETLSNSYRFEMELEPGGADAMDVREEYVSYTRYELVNYDVTRLQVLVRNGRASRAVLDAVQKAAGMHSAINESVRRLNTIRDELAGITRDQGRLRENMNTVREGSELYKRYLDKLTEQEDRIEALEDARSATETLVEEQRRALNEYLRNLKVE